jgi:hypothetical protein
MQLDNGEFKRFFQYDPVMFPNGGTYFDTKRPFNEYNGTLLYHYIFSDTIYALSDSSFAPHYAFDFEDMKPDIDFNRQNVEKTLEYFQSSPNKAYYLQNIIENQTYIKFSYLLGSQLHEAIYDKRTRQVKEGKFVNDLFAANMNFLCFSGDTLIAYMNPEDEITIQTDVSGFLPDEKITKIKALQFDDNPVLVKMILKKIE